MAEFDATKMDSAAKQADAELEQIKGPGAGGWGLVRANPK